MWPGRLRPGRKPWASTKGLEIRIFRKNLTCECYSLANTWAMDLKLSGVLCFPKVRQTGIAHLEMRRARTEAWGQPHRPKEKFLSSTQVIHAQKEAVPEKDPGPQSPLKSIQGGAGHRQRRGLSPAKPIQNPQGIKKNLGDKKVKSDLVSSVLSLVHWLPGQHVA